MYCTIRRLRKHNRAFTFIELVVAVALSIVLIRGMYTVFHSATKLTSMSEERMQILLESSAVYEFLASDLTRAVTETGDYYFNTTSGGSTFTFKAKAQSTSYDVFIRYTFSDAGKSIRRDVLNGSGSSPGAAVDDDGDGNVDSNLIVGNNIGSFDVEYHTEDPASSTDGSINDGSGGISTNCWGAGTASRLPKAIKFEITFKNPFPKAIDDGGLDDEAYIMIISVMSQ
jgi:Tfp pilus assembly protein PilE